MVGHGSSFYDTSRPLWLSSITRLQYYFYGLLWMRLLWFQRFQLILCCIFIRKIIHGQKSCYVLVKDLFHAVKQWNCVILYYSLFFQYWIFQIRIDWLSHYNLKSDPTKWKHLKVGKRCSRKTGLKTRGR